VDALRRCCSETGLKASGDRLGHHQIWARDAMIAALGGVLTGDPQILDALRATVRILREYQAANGCIPNNVDAQSLRPNFRAYADAGLWWIIGSSLINPDPATTAAVLRWYECQDVDQTGLLSMQESADWQDLFCTRGKGLSLNCLYVLALEAASGIFDSAGQVSEAIECRTRADCVRRQINRYFWYRGDKNMLRHIAHTFSTESPQEQDSLGRKRWLPQKNLLAEEQYYLPYLAFRTPGEWFDSLGHMLAILAGVAEPQQCRLILDFIERHRLAAAPMKAIYPAIHRPDADWRDYYGMLNLPHHYHNGGVWPFIGGFYVAALVKMGEIEKAASALERLGTLNSEGQFNEWHHGETAEALGVRYQAWSAGMYIYAHECVKQNRVLLLDCNGSVLGAEHDQRQRRDDQSE
jgi:hypothetical protein